MASRTSIGAWPEMLVAMAAGAGALQGLAAGKLYVRSIPFRKSNPQSRITA